MYYSHHGDAAADNDQFVSEKDKMDFRKKITKKNAIERKCSCYCINIMTNIQCVHA